MYIQTISHYLPGKVVPNSYFTELNGLTDDWIRERTGIRERRRTEAGENTHTMAIEAIKAGLPHLPYPVSEIGLVVAATYTPYDTVSTLAHAVQNFIDVADIPAVSLSSACSSLLNGLEVAEGYFAMGKADKALVVVSDNNSAYSDDHDKVAGHLWGDGSAAFFLSKERVTDQDIEIQEIITAGAATVGRNIEGVTLRPNHGGLHMAYGKDVFMNACVYMEEVSRRILKKHGYGPEDVSYFAPHQANYRISRQVLRNMEVPEERLLSNIEVLGNTGSAGCGIALSQNRHRFQTGDLLLMAVFGGGYSYGAMLMKA
ncbi:MAG: ketoacyl-ACP synthase III [Bacteroidetes bacterium]|nr:MAG: ketoacyl-ACP synthase III [Bacteroidota bacterium]